MEILKCGIVRAAMKIFTLQDNTFNCTADLTGRQFSHAGVVWCWGAIQRCTHKYECVQYNKHDIAHIKRRIPSQSNTRACSDADVATQRERLRTPAERGAPRASVPAHGLWLDNMRLRCDEMDKTTEWAG